MMYFGFLFILLLILGVSIYSSSKQWVGITAVSTPLQGHWCWEE